ncbi:hypothetical protein MIMGU_mgv1a0021232mg, partial [Erythranthe guttata]
MEVSMRP